MASRQPEFLPCDHPLTQDAPVLLFDGICNLCNGWAAFVIRNDPEGRIRLAPMQSDSGQTILRALGLPTDRYDSLIFVEQGHAWFRSTAVLRLLGHLRRRWHVMRALGMLPRSWRDAGYDLVARNRYRMFGKRDACMIPTADISERFLA